MKTRNWIILFCASALFCALISVVFFFGDEEKNSALVYSDGLLVQTIDLTQDAEYRINFGEEWNILTVKNGEISVTSASCSTQDCVHRGGCNRGAPIVCLPNRLVIEFEQRDTLDAVLR